MAHMTIEELTERLELADQLYFGRNEMLEPQDLPGRYGRVIKALDHLVEVTKCPTVVGGGWAVWRHGFVGRVTYDIDIAVPADRIGEFMQAASVSGFRVLPQPAGRWPKLLHKETDIKVDILPEGAQPGTPNHLAPTTIPHPKRMGAVEGRLAYISLASLIELKIAAGRNKDEQDVIQLIAANPNQLNGIRRHLEEIHPDYAAKFELLVAKSIEDADER